MTCPLKNVVWKNRVAPTRDMIINPSLKDLSIRNRPTPRSATGNTTGIGSSVRSAGASTCSWTSSAKTAISCLTSSNVQRPDGSLEPLVEDALQQMAAWIAIQGEAMYGTRPWPVYGEGAVRIKGAVSRKTSNRPAPVIRFTAQDKTLYATAVGWPEDRQLVVKSLARPAGESGNATDSVSLYPALRTPAYARRRRPGR
jgi:hypothetical protein